MEESAAGRAGLPPGVKVMVLGPAPSGLVQVLWGAGLRPVRGRTAGSLWALPAERGQL